jgi:hypothetical protein
MKSAAVVILAGALLVAAGGPAQADLNDLSGGVFIAHFVPELVYSQVPDDACGDYAAYAISSAEQQVHRIDTQELSTWFVLSAWCQEKEFCGVQFGFGAYDPAPYAFTSWGPCGAGVLLELPSDGWPGPLEGTAITGAGTSITWAGNYVPIYFFCGYAYGGQTMIPLDEDHSVFVPFGGWGNCDLPVAGIYPAEAYGGMGIYTEGIYIAPMAPSPTAPSSWGALKSIYR